jgi:hypothetical protein
LTFIKQRDILALSKGDKDMRVYILATDFNGIPRILGVFDTNEKAKQAQKKYNNIWTTIMIREVE